MSFGVYLKVDRQANGGLILLLLMTKEMAKLLMWEMLVYNMLFSEVLCLLLLIKKHKIILFYLYSTIAGIVEKFSASAVSTGSSVHCQDTTLKIKFPSARNATRHSSKNAVKWPGEAKRVELMENF